jgi:hypothetical protein
VDQCWVASQLFTALGPGGRWGHDHVTAVQWASQLLAIVGYSHSINIWPSVCIIWNNSCLLSNGHSMKSLPGDKRDEGGHVFCLHFIVKSQNSTHSICKQPSEKTTYILLMSPSYPWEGSTTWFYSML